MMRLRWQFIYLAILAGLLHTDGAHGQAIRSITDAFDIVRHTLNNQKNLPEVAKVFLDDAVSNPSTNIWRVLSMGQAQYNLSEACSDSTQYLLSGLASGQPWAIAMLDSIGKLESGFLLGNRQWLGSFTECQSVQVPFPQSNNTNHTQPTGDMFEGTPCTASMRNEALDPAVAPGIKVLICLPSTCSNEDAELIWHNFLSLTKNYTGDIVCYESDQNEYDAPAIAMIVLLTCLGALIVVGTMYDLLFVQGAWYQMQNHSDKPPLEVNAEAGDQDAATGNDYAPMNDTATKTAPRPATGVVSQLLVSFSVATNAAKILSTKKSQASLDAIHGIRFISMTWVILGHTFVFGLGSIANAYDVYVSTIKTWHFQAILNATVSVDTFFVLSGTLLAYLMLKELEKCGGPKNLNWAKFYFHRFWRLTPPYMLILGAYVSLFKYLGTGPVWPQDGTEPFCAKNWWTNFLYINNIVDSKEMCFGWAWYLANDMQFFVISPIFVVALYMNWIVGVVITLVTMLATFLSTALITVHYGYGASLISSLTNPNMATWMQNVYVTPWCRIGPYLVGLLYGYLIFRTKRQVTIHPTLIILGWMTAAAAALAVLYGLYPEANGHPLSQSVAAFYAAMHRTVWGAAVGWVIFACVTGYGGWVNRFLSWSAFLPLSRLTYMAYLVHPIVIYLFYDSLKRTLFVDTLTWIYLFLGHVVLSYGVAFIASLSIEAPMMGLERVLLKR